MSAIKDWDHFYRAIKTMRMHQRVYFDCGDQVAAIESAKMERLIDECIAEREMRAAMEKSEKKTGGTYGADEARG